MDALTPELAARLARIALGHVGREYPHHLAHLMGGPQDAVRSPRALHPVFHGSYDWHSCVHGYWLLARLRPILAGAPERAAIDALFEARLTAPNIAVERAYMAERPGFERPYGWAWLLKLQQALRLQPDAAAWAQALAPLADLVAERLAAFLPRATYPVRAGVHTNTAFALRLALDYADTAGNTALAAVIVAKARAWHGGDRDAQAWEPSGDDFLSPVLMVAELMRRALPPAAFRPWFAACLPRLAQGEPAALLTPAEVSDRSDGKTAHLDGLNLSRAWCWRRIGEALDPADPTRPIAEAAAARHLAAGLPQVAGDYMGEHWLASFALLALGGD